MAGPALFVPIIMAGARAITRLAPQIAKRFINQGKAKKAEDVLTKLGEEIAKKTEKGYKVIVKSGSRKVGRLPTNEANTLIKQGKAQAATTVLKQLEKSMKTVTSRPYPKSTKPPVKKATGGQIKKYAGGKKITRGTVTLPIKAGPAKPLGVGKAIKGWGKGYK